MIEIVLYYLHVNDNHIVMIDHINYRVILGFSVKVLPSPARAKLKLYRALAMVLLSLGRIIIMK